MNNPTDDRPLESRIAAAYVQLALSSTGQDGARSVTLAKIGRLDVRLVEHVPPGPTDERLFWLELYDNDAEAAIDSCGCDDLQDAATAAEQLIGQARALTQAESATTRRIPQ